MSVRASLSQVAMKVGWRGCMVVVEVEWWMFLGS